MDEPVTRKALLRQGWTQRDLDTALREHRLARVVRGSFTPPADLSPREQHLLLTQAVMPMVHASSVVSHVSAAVLHGLSVPEGGLDVVHVTRAGGTKGRRTRNVHLHVAPLGPDEVCEVGGFRATDLARTVTDFARTHDLGWGVVVADEALSRGVDSAALVPSGDAVRRIRTARVLAVARLADGRSESPLESLSRVALLAGGLPVPVLQHEVHDCGVLVARADFAWPEFGVLGEADGKVKYGPLLRAGETPEDAVMREKRREQRLRDLGWLVVRWDWRDCHDGTMLRRVRRTLSERGWGAAA